MSVTKLIFIDSFDHYSSSQKSRKWTDDWPYFSIVAGRTGNGAQIANGGPTKTFGDEYTELGAGVAYNTQAFGNAPITFKNDVTGARLGMVHLGDGRMAVYCQCNETGGIGPWTPSGGNTAVSGTIQGPPSTIVLHINEWYYLELQGTIAMTTLDTTHSTLSFAGNAYVNGALLCSITQSGTVVTSNYGTHATFAGVSIGGPGGGYNAIFDDFYVTDGELFGDVKIAVLYPNAAGDSSAWTPNGSGANYTKVKEHVADDDTTYVSASGPGVLDLYNLDDITAFTGIIKGAQSCILARRSDAGYATLVSEMKSGGTIQDGAPWNPSATNYIYGLDAWRQSPFTLSDWTTPEINALQLGQKRFS